LLRITLCFTLPLLFSALLSGLLLLSVALCLLSLLLLFPLLPLRRALRFLLRPSLVALSLIFLAVLLPLFPAFLPATTTTLRARDVGDAD
jgi:hypothetical protein